ncbi:MAG: 50S ribosomal protein L35 [Nitrospiraceae bacterium]|nr:50S ribosomal protein L35 [Nitrospiraceae bacterium]MDO9117323.1 50S ribosomal protein L35 [Nitrospira sp.]OQW66459.1 MAG: 50S ribosomal protein L35 [Nitrospira sp. ST-bin5]THJ21243.1 MAG: 50S ribosomal protein L35 [Nitrospira sp. CG24D]MDP3091494.1 50S ribosomal protein L35 [Nitrospira sp.]
MKTKAKTHKGAKKRFSRTGSGKLVRRKAGKRHLLSHKKSDQKRRLSGTAVVDATSTLSLNRLLPYN